MTDPTPTTDPTPDPTAPPPRVAPTLHPEIAAYLTKHKDTVATTKRTIHDAILATHRVAALARHLALDLRTDLNEAEYAAHNHAIDDRLTFMHTRISELEVAASDLEQAMKRLARGIRAVEVGHETDPDVLARLIEAHS